MNGVAGNGPKMLCVLCCVGLPHPLNEKLSGPKANRVCLEEYW